MKKRIIFATGNENKMKEILENAPICFSVNRQIRHISFSYGIVAFQEKEGKIADMVKEADQRMYQCKKRNHSRSAERGEK